MSLSNTDRLWSQPRTVVNNKLQGRTVCGWRRGHVEVGQHISGTNIPVMAPTDKHRYRYNSSAGMTQRIGKGGIKNFRKV